MRVQASRQRFVAPPGCDRRRKSIQLEETKMTKLNITAIAAAISLAFSAGVIAENLSKDQYKSGKDGIAAEYKTAKAECGSLSGNAKDICMAEAGARKRSPKRSWTPETSPRRTPATRWVSPWQTPNYAVAKERCDDNAGNVKDVCVKEAKAAAVAAKADAKTQMKVADANKEAAKTSAKATDKANEKSADARKDAAAAKRDADYVVAKEKCDAFAGDAKSSCLSEAKARFGKS